MNRNSLLEISGRAMHQFVRFTLNKSNDDPMMQELHVDGMLSDVRSIVERIQHFGFTSTPLPRDQQQQGQQGQQGGSSGGDQIKGPAAEAIGVFLGGQRNHPVVIAVDDRRHRPMGLKPGENAQYDDIGQMTLLRRTGLFLLSLDGDQSQQSSGGKDASGSSSSSQSTERMVSIRHVEKQKQQRGKVGASGGGGGSGGSGGSSRTIEITEHAAAGGQQSKQDYKHEGETVNNEMRVTKKRIEFRSGDDVVGYYDKQSKTWCFIGQVKLGTESAAHPVYGVNQGLGMTTNASGSGAVLVDAPKPGPPTSQDERP